MDPCENEEENIVKYLYDLKDENGEQFFKVDKQRVMYLSNLESLLSKNYVKPDVPSLSIFHPKSREEYSQFEKVCSVGFDDLDYSPDVVADLHLNMTDPNYFRLVGKANIDGNHTICSCGSTLSRGDGIATIQEMAVLPEARRRGYASQVMKELVRHAVARGCHTVVLSGTSMGEPTWAAMGFQPLPAFVYMCVRD